MSWVDLKARLGVETDFEDAYVEECYDVAVVLVDLALANAFRLPTADVLNLLYMEVGANLYERKSQPSTNSQYTGYEGTPVAVRQPRDPLATVRPIIARFVVPL